VKKLKLDLGCGQHKQQGYVGIDRMLISGVDVVCDINRGIPFADHSISEVMASHVLEHVEDLIASMEEIYRVCKHKAVVCILAPYAHTSLNMANPFHRFQFNEHTPRFFTACADSLIEANQYEFPFITQWGLGKTENPNMKMDFRCIRMELFYFPRYAALSMEEQTRLRQTQLNVADQIMYHLVAVKQSITREELMNLANLPLEVPSFVTYRRAYENR
jgi:SAM-dependent methyltransferase